MPRAILLLLSFGVLAGCGQGRGDLTGNVTYNGKPVVRGSVSVAPAGQPPKTVPIQDGTYAVTDLPAGPAKIAVHSPNPNESLVISREPPAAKPKGKAKAAKGPDPSGWFPIPERYGHFDRSELTFQVAPGPNKFDLDLKGP